MPTAQPPEGHSTQDSINQSSELDLQFLSEGGVLSALAKSVMDSVGADGIALAYAVNGSVICRASCGTNAPPVGTPVNMNSGIGAQCLREGKTITCADTESDPRVNKEVCRAIGVRSMMAVPLRQDGQTIGVAQVFYSQADGFSEASAAELEASSELFISCLPETKARIEQAPVDIPELEVVVDEDEVVPQAAPPTVDETEPDLTKSESYSEHVVDRQPITGIAQSESPSAKQNDQNSPQPQDDFIEPAMFAQLQEVVWWRRSTTVATALLVLCVLLWAGARAANRAGSSSKSPEPTLNVNEPKAEAKDATIAELLMRAKSGDQQAQFALAQRYQTGMGVAKNLRKAYSWYIIAGEAGSDSAKQAIRSLTPKLTADEIAAIRFDVAKMYATGVTRRDNIAAYKWLVLADAAGNHRAKAEAKKLAASMRPPEIAEAQNQAFRWLGRRSSLQLLRTANTQ